MTFTVPSERTVRISVKDNSGHHIVINRWQGAVVCQLVGQNSDADVRLPAGDYVVSLVAKRGRVARATVDIR